MSIYTIIVCILTILKDILGTIAIILSFSIILHDIKLLVKEIYGYKDN